MEQENREYIGGAMSISDTIMLTPAEAQRARNYLMVMPGFNSDEMFEWLCQVGFFKAPASIHHHGAYPGALYDHSFTVMQALLSLTRRLGLKWERKRSPYIVGMFHDLCKVEAYRERRETHDEWGQAYKDNERWEYNNAVLLPGHGEKSVMLLQQHFEPLTEEEMLCIRWHMGAFDEKENWNSYGRSITEFPNVLYTHTADMIAARVMGV